MIRLRQFLLGGYHDLPNVLFVGSLLIGSITGYLPLVWVSIGLIFNAFNVAILQGILRLLFSPGNVPYDNQIYMTGMSAACNVVFPGNRTKMSLDGTSHIVAPSYWLASAIFFATFSVYNSIRVGLLPNVKGANQDKTDARRAFTLTTFIIGVVFFILTLARGFGGCETYFGAGTGIAVGMAGAIAFWHFLDACGTAMVPDVLQVVNSMPPPGKNNEIPVVCAAESST
jgi:hypothetical protein